MKPITYRAAALRSLIGLPKRDRLAILAKLARYAETGAGDVRALTGRPGKRLRPGITAPSSWRTTRPLTCWRSATAATSMTEEEGA